MVQLSDPLLVIFVAGILDLCLGDPQYRLHPVRLLGDLSQFFEKILRALRCNGYIAGALHLALVLGLALGVWWGIRYLAGFAGPWPIFLVDTLLAWQLLCFRDLLDHGRRVLKAPSIEKARSAVGMLVGRDTHRMDEAATVRSTVESLSENLTDGVLTPVMALCIGGLPALIAIKVISTMDSMVGYKNERYLRYGWASARSDDLIHFLPARLSLFLIAISAVMVRGYPISALTCAWREHRLLESPNSGWSEAAIAGALRLRLLGPIYLNEKLVNERWMGDPNWQTQANKSTLAKALWIIFLSGLMAWAIGIGCHYLIYHVPWPSYLEAIS